MRLFRTASPAGGLPVSLLGLLKITTSIIIIPFMAGAAVRADLGQALGSVLAGFDNLSTYYGLLKVSPVPSSSRRRFPCENSC